MFFFSFSHLLPSHKNLAYAVNAHTHTHHWDDISAVVRVTSSLSHSFKFQALLRKSHYFYKNMSCSCPIKDNISHELTGSVETNEFLLRNISFLVLGQMNKVLCFAHGAAAQGSVCTFLLDLMPNKNWAPFCHDLILIYLTSYWTDPTPHNSSLIRTPVVAEIKLKSTNTTM